MPVVDNAIYVDGRRQAEPASLEVTYEMLRRQQGMGWIGLYRPDASEMRSVAAEFQIHDLAVEDTVSAHQRPKLERYGDVLFTVLRPARYVEAEERVEFGELHVFTGKDFIVTVRHAESPNLRRVRQRLESDPDLLRLGPEAVLYAILDEVVDEYQPVVAGLENDIDEIEDQVFTGDPAVSRRIYELSREVVEFQRATTPLLKIVADLASGFEKYHVDEEMQRYLRDVQDHTIRIAERVDGFRVLLQNILTVNATLVGQRQNEETQRLTETSLRQNEEVKKISSWAAILFAPTLVGTIYGMNFEHMPELDWRLGYPMALALMLLMGAVLYAVFKRRGWL
ncbi:magnesium and cobalt transport protein CorA [Nocardioides jishulii]|uniref:Magnesium and cobalt transport protein CorA n=1 Tax=Nocardioides jishulii TaxID=2575440 RepID=A0A4U2YKZ3_9ACTN|nr:magnesium and cobalt transport protein CorA [Nocardioides jishulii]QCX26961.1 magnesium and cobalt transport protein CorA [Nocardioides jishulii]TKI61444.1 magnesium and cobalt transport protein CorA [Nocardioides jishulii]